MAEIRVKETGTIKLFESDNTSSVTIASPASLGADRTITLPDANVTLASGTMNDATNLSGNIPVSNLNSGTSASSSTFWRGDGTWVAPSGGAALTGSTDNTVVTVTGADAIQGEANLKFDGTDLTVETGNVVIGTAGKGIDFSAQTPAATTGATTVAEILDHYEEGTWTPQLGAGGTVGTIGGSNFTRIGNLCHCWIQFNMTGIPNNATMFQIGGLPFTSAASSAYGGGGVSGAVNGGYDWSDAGFNTGLSGTMVYWHKINNSTAVIANSDVDGMTQWTGNIWYWTA